MEILYDSLIKSSLGREDVAKLEKESVANSHEIKQTFRCGSCLFDRGSNDEFSVEV